MGEGSRGVRSVNGVVVDLDAESLLAPGGDRTSLRPRSFATLRHLLAHPNRLVSKAELMEAVWPKSVVTDDSLVQCVHEIRRALADDDHAVLQTVSRRGYRLVLPELRGAWAASGPSIAVMPFEVLAAGVEDWFADGLVEDVIASLSRIAGLFVVARNSSFAYRGRAMASQVVAAELGVRYLLEGSLRRSGARIRIGAHLVDGASGGDLWAGRFDGAAEDVFDLQDQLTEQIAGVIEPSLRRAEIARARRKRPDSLDAYDHYLRALPQVFANTPDACEAALLLLGEALRLDPSFLAAHGCAAWCREQRFFRGGFDPDDRRAALAHADAALGPGADDAQAMSMAAFVRANLTQDYDAAVETLDRALALNGNSALAYGFSALVGAHSERDDRAVAHAMRALRLSPLDDPLNYHPWCALALTSLFAGRFDEAIAHANLAIRANPGFSVAYAYLIAGCVNDGRVDAAQAAAWRLLEIAPAFTISGFARMGVFRPPLMDRLTAALRKTTLPET